ncbi:hypothetical protein [Streptomyces spectabilis]|uniref:Uncharacterized protein n=1 Tax=Streptomyces spectabilis TaxID=68270 RepID=A0A7W8B3F4_STRST|nr:hypothetical protein [Streptomyces spectabilis]MBB5109635.1 hypothetical protein [Streptomyces spectabilis]
MAGIEVGASTGEVPLQDLDGRHGSRAAQAQHRVAQSGDQDVPQQRLP